MSQAFSAAAVERQIDDAGGVWSTSDRYRLARGNQGGHEEQRAMSGLSRYKTNRSVGRRSCLALADRFLRRYFMPQKHCRLPHDQADRLD
jgi:hypothetical protein